MKVVFVSFVIFFAAISFCTTISDLSTASATITIDGFDVEKLYFIPYYEAQYANNERILQSYSSYWIEDHLLEPGNENLLGYLVFETIDATFFKIGHGPFVLLIPEEYVSGEFKPSYSEYSSLSGHKLKFYQTKVWSSLTHYMGGGLVSYPIYNDAIDRNKPFELNMEFYVVSRSDEKIRLKIIVNAP